MNKRDLMGKHYGETCFILGNGPSLRDVDLEGLRAQGVVLGSNRIYLSGFTPDYYAAVNPLVIEQYADEIARLDCVKFLPETYAAGMGPQVIGIRSDYRVPSFRDPLREPVWEGYTVTYVLLQLAYAMGFTKVILLGVDHYYGTHAATPNRELEAHGPDEHHFHPDYFSGGAKWNAPDLAMSELAYSLAKQAYETAGSEIINCTRRTRLGIFNRKPLGAIFAQENPRVSVIVSAYKAEDYLEGCLIDIMRQDEKALQVVAVAQRGSAEAEILAGYNHGGQLDAQKTLEIVLTDDVPTVYRAWNLGIEQATGEYLTNWNTDDRRAPQSIKLMADVLAARPEIDLVYHDVFITWQAHQSYADFTAAHDWDDLVRGRMQGQPGIFLWPEYRRELLGQGCFMGPMPLWRRELHQRYGGFDGQMTSAGDYEFWLRIAKEKNMLHIGYPLGLYLARPDGIELGNPAVGSREATTALFLHQEPEFTMEYLAEIDQVRVQMADKWTFVAPQKILDFVPYVQKERA